MDRIKSKWDFLLHNNQPTCLTRLLWKFQLTNVHKIDIFQSGIRRVAVQIFLRFSNGKYLSVFGQVSKKVYSLQQYKNKD